ncbi:hypothetical protein PO909_008490 [Leuciscus waleckii]
MSNHYLGRLLGRGKFSERNKVRSFRKSIHDGQDDSITGRLGKTCNKVKCDMGPRARRNGEGSKKTGRRRITRFSLSANGARSDKASRITFESGPPETLTNDRERAPNAGMDSQFRGVSPLKHR